jgi:hypothetical protein
MLSHAVTPFLATNCDKLSELALTRQGFSVLGSKHRSEFPFDFPGIAFNLLFHLHREVPLGVCDGHNSHRRDVPMIHESEIAESCMR